ncbi:zinc-binding dehydrogenase [Bermanella marisrubri]|uniref:Zinc-binding dehydrogenase family protein n=1 Tax=Bermanella marisrubri TaxID=207949 RepID=Q1N5U6_9GAMM|nr:zinc-binding dehydrogenase [Bermanella marisrubri]EAT13846.1 zinc-binding dehydrogenase family protein [Oceanobacter sp. RED65] [Bermanella marisrubri]QIZ84608.1 zinc-binding dehydrogenase [Bermanella marisrubri]
MRKREWRTPKAGAISRLFLHETDLASLSAENIRVEVKAVGLNFADIFALTGLYSATPEGAFVPGLEFSGVVVESHDPSFAVGDAVMGVTRFGGYRTVIDSTAHYLSPLPEGWSFQQGAAYLVQTLTAYYALRELGNLKMNQRVLIHSAAGGVGLQAMKLAKALGARPTGTVSLPRKQAYLQQLGFEEVFVRQAPFKTQVDEIAKQQGDGFDLVLDGVGGEVQKSSFEHLNPMGRLIVFGAAEFTPGKNRPNYIRALFKYINRPKYDVMDMISENKSVMAFNLIWLWEQVDYLTTLIRDMRGIDIDPPVVGHEYDFEQALDAIECLRSGNTVGKVVLNIT